MMVWRSKNFGLHAMDPSYDMDYDEDADYEAYEDALAEKSDAERELMI